MNRRVVITGQGAITSLGFSANNTIEAMSNGVCGISELDFRDVERLTITIGGQIHDYDPAAHFTRSQIALYDRFTQFALIAAEQAVRQSGIRWTEQLHRDTGVILGTAGGGLQTQDENFHAVYEEGKNRVHPFIVPRLMASAAVSHVSMTYDLQGPSFTVSTACASSNHAIGQAYRAIKNGEAQVMLTGGSEAMLNFGGIKAWEGLRVMSKDGCRPFCATRNGMVQGEGAAVFVLEDYDHAFARGADVLAEVVGFAMTSDAHDIVMPSKAGALRAMQGALKEAGMSGSEIGYVNAHGTGTTMNDRIECASIADALGRRDVMVSSTKSMHGHVIGGTGAIELLACTAALRDGMIAPTIGHSRDDPECNLDIVKNEARQEKVTACLSNAFAFGGLNAVLALRAV